MSDRLLLVEDRENLRAILARALGSRFDVEAVGDGAAAVAALRAGAYDYLSKPVEPDDLVRIASRAADRFALVWRTRELQALGEAGSGKEIAAREIHRVRNEDRFVAVSCGGGRSMGRRAGRPRARHCPRPTTPRRARSRSRT